MRPWWNHLEYSVMALSTFLTPGERRATPEMCGFVNGAQPTPEYRLPAHRLQIRQYLLDVFLSCIPSELLSYVRPRGTPPT